MRRGASQLSLAVLTLFAVAACATETPRTQVMVTVDASNDVRAATRTLELVVVGGPASAEAEPRTWTESYRQDWSANAIEWPVLLALVPKGNNASRGYFVIATAKDARGTTITRVRTRSGYVAGQTLWLRITLDSGDTCQPSDDAYCRDDVVLVDELKPWRGPMIDAGSDASLTDSAVSNDAGADASDAARDVDATADASPLADATVDAPQDASVDTGPIFDCTLLNCDDNKQCTTDRCDPRVGCVYTTRVGSCDDNNRCTTNDSCLGEACVGTIVTCQANAACRADTGICACGVGAIACGGSCILGAVCCPNSTNGSCGQCGTSTCNSTGTSYDCLGQHGNCTGGSCLGAACGPETGGACPTGTRRECGPECNWSGCF